ncbi:glycine-rich protein [Nocardioides sp. GXZ039]|uniref:glycine-rich protein n=1 Tax=Nocardioides sp. GXZ039 TaxID=3136018 RepID=UPI0030F3CC6D
MRTTWASRPRIVPAVVGAVIVAAAALATAGGASGAPGKGSQEIFDAPGTYAWTVPNGVKSVTVLVRGAAGGHSASASGGVGGESQAKLAVAPGQSLQIVVGGRGQGVEPGGAAGGAGGFNGGGDGTDAGLFRDPGAGGGGASDIRIDALSGACAAALTCPLSARIVVAGGGGGAGGDSGSPLDGGAGGGFAGLGSGAGAGGTQDGGSGFGTGGSGDSADCPCSAGGGGGGWFGGNHGAPGAGGGGGSGYVNPLVVSGSSSVGNIECSVGSCGDGLVVLRW